MTYEEDYEQYDIEQYNPPWYDKLWVNFVRLIPAMKNLGYNFIYALQRLWK